MREYQPFSLVVKDEIRRQQRNRCAVCGAVGHLTIHHKIPSTLSEAYGLTPEQTRSRENAVGVCRTPCHDWLDKKALQEHRFYPEVMHEMKKDRWYNLREKIRDRLKIDAMME